MISDRRLRSILAPTILLATTLVPVSFGGTREVTLSDQVPGNTMFFASVDIGRMVAEHDSLDLMRLYNDEEVQEFLQPLVEWVEEESGDAQAMLATLRSFGLPGIISGRIQAAIPGAGVFQPDGTLRWFDAATIPSPAEMKTYGNDLIVMPELILSVETSGREAFEESLQRALGLIPTAVVTTPSEREGFAYRTTTMDLPEAEGKLTVFHGYVGDRFLLTLREDRLQQIASAFQPRGQQGDRLSTDETYQEWQRTTIRGTEVIELYAGLGHMMGGMQRYIESKRDRAQFLRSGLADVQGAGYAMAMESGRVRESFAAVLPPERRGVFRLLDAFGAGTPIAAGIPANTTSALSVRVDPLLFWDRLVEFIGIMDPPGREAMNRELTGAGEEFGFDIRDDLVASIGPELTIHTTLPKSGFIPNVVGTVSVKDPEKFGRVIEEVKELIRRESGGDVGIENFTISDQIGGTYLSIPGAPVSPAMCLADGVATFALSTADLKRWMNREAGPGIAEDSPDFARCVATTVGQDFGAVTGMVYIDVAAAAEYGLGMAEMFLPAMLTEMPFEMDASLMPFPETIASYLSGMLSTIRVTDRAIALDNSSPFSGLLLHSMILAPIFWLAPYSVGAPVADDIVLTAHYDEEEIDPLPSPESPFIGFNYEDDAQSGNGVVISSIISGTPAETAGLQANDVIVTIDGTPVASPSDLPNVMSGKKVGQDIVIEVLRNGETYTFPVTLGRRGNHVQEP